MNKNNSDGSQLQIDHLFINCALFRELFSLLQNSFSKITLLVLVKVLVFPHANIHKLV